MGWEDVGLCKTYFQGKRASQTTVRITARLGNLEIRRRHYSFVRKENESIRNLKPLETSKSKPKPQCYVRML
jgi:hypothetical protein